VNVSEKATSLAGGAKAKASSSMAMDVMLANCDATIAKASAVLCAKTATPLVLKDKVVSRDNCIQ
jgi:hypothetical protein